MFGIGLPELLLILALALIVLGPDRLPQVARQLARFFGELKRAGEDFKRQLDLESLKDLKEGKSWNGHQEADSGRPVSGERGEGEGRQAGGPEAGAGDEAERHEGTEWKVAERKEEGKAAGEAGSAKEGGGATSRLDEPGAADPRRPGSEA